MLIVFSTYNDHYITKKGNKTSGRADYSRLCRIMRASYARFCVGSVMERSAAAGLIFTRDVLLIALTAVSAQFFSPKKYK